jgi:UDP-glucuronate 4-epimerase
MTAVGRYLVTGCAGFIGSHLVEALVDRGDEVLGVDSFTDYYARSIKEANLARVRARPGFTFVEADAVEVDLAPLVAATAGVFHLAAQPGVRASWGDSFPLYVRENVIATQRVFEAAARAEIRVVFASSSSVYGNSEAYPTAEEVRPRPISPYGVTKLSCEHLASAYAESLGLDVVALRYFTVYGPRQRPDMAFARLTRAVARREPFHVYGTGEQSRDFTYVGDAVAATHAAMDRAPSGAVYNVGGGAEASLREVIDLCERLSGRTTEVVFDDSIPGDVRRTAADTSRIRAELGWAPETPLEAGIAVHLAWSESVFRNFRTVNAPPAR